MKSHMPAHLLEPKVSGEIAVPNLSSETEVDNLILRLLQEFEYLDVTELIIKARTAIEEQGDQESVREKINDASIMSALARLVNDGKVTMRDFSLFSITDR